MKSAEVIFLTGVMTPWFERSIGAYQMSNFIKSHGYTTQVIDYIHLIPKETILELLKHFTSNETKFLGISTTFLSDQVHVAAEKKKYGKTLRDDFILVLTEYKKLYPHVKIVAGGAKAKTLEEYSFVDHIITGYGEIGFLKLIQNENTSKIISGDLYLKDFDAQQINHLFCDDDLIFENETLPLEISRGCIFRCKFCAYPLNGKKKLDHIRDVEHIKKELINNYEKWGVTNYLISDDTFNDSNDKLEMLHKMITSLPFKISFVCYLRVDLLYRYRDTQLKLLEEMGLKSCHFGVESFNPETAKFIGKGMSEDKTKDFLLYLKDRWKNKISFMCTFIFGLPYESKESCIDTGNWCLDNDINFWIMPLFINPNNVYRSDIDINYKLYGYTLEYIDGNIKWQTEYMNFDEALKMSNTYTDQVVKSLKISAWNKFAIASLGIHTIDELYHLGYQELDKQLYSNTIKDRVSQYTRKLLSL